MGGDSSDADQEGHHDREEVEGREEVGLDGVGRDGGDRGRHGGVWLDGGVLGRGGRDDERGGGGGKLSLWRKAQARVSAAVCRGRANARQAIEGRHRAGKRGEQAAKAEADGLDVLRLARPRPMTFFSVSFPSVH